MNQTTATLILIALVAVIFIAMWFAWKRRGRRDETVLAPEQLSGEVTTEFDRIFYVATTAQGQPLDGVALPGLKYRGYATIRLHTDGIEVQVLGEHAVSILASRLINVSTAQMRIDKVVERGGLLVMTWQAQDRVLETSFRLTHPDEQGKLADALQELLSHAKAQRNGTNNETFQSGQEA